MNNITKWDKGRAVLLGGSKGTLFTTNNAVESARRTGAGLVVAAVKEELISGLESISGKYKIQGFNLQKPEEILELINKSNSLGAGFGIEDDFEDEKVKKFYLKLLESINVTSVLDADLIMFIKNNKQDLNFKKQHILTYNIKEADLYFGNKNPEDRIVVAEAMDLNCWLVLKAGITRIFSPKGEITKLETNQIPEMTVAGMGDVLTGAIAGFLAQGYSQKQSIEKSLKIRELASKHYLEKTNSTFVLPEDVIASMPYVIKTLVD